MPTFQHGKDFYMYIGGYDLTNYFKDWKSSIAVDKADSSTAGSSAKSSLPGQRSGTWALSGLWDATAGASHDRLKTILGLTGTVLTGGWSTDAVGNPCQLALGYGAKYEPGANIGSVVSADAEIEVSGGIWPGYTLHEKKAETTTSTGYTTVDRGVGNTTSNGYSLNLHVFTVSGTAAPTLTVTVEHATTDFGSPATVDTFTAATAVGAENKSGTTSLRRYVRVKWTISGTNPSFIFAAELGIK